MNSQADLISDETIKHTGQPSSKKYLDNLRLAMYEDFRDGTVFGFLTNNYSIEALTVTELYREKG